MKSLGLRELEMDSGMLNLAIVHVKVLIILIISKSLMEILKSSYNQEILGFQNSAY